MEFTVFHVLNKPIELDDRVNYEVEWKIKASSLLENKPNSSDSEGWQKINTELDDLQLELRKKYPCKTTWIIDKLEDLDNLINIYGTLSFCKEDEKNIIYIMDVSETQKVEVKEK